MKYIIILFIGISFLTIPYADYLDGLKGYWKFDGDLLDSSGNGHNASASGSTWAQGQFGQAASFDGINDYISIPTLTNTNFVISMWLKTDLSKRYALVNFEGNSLSDWGLETNSGKLRISELGSHGHESSSSLNANEWNHIIFDNINGRYYVNGQLDNSFTKVHGLAPNWLIGWKGSYGNQNFLNGQIDEFAVYDRALQLDDIQYIMNHGVNIPAVPEASTLLLWIIGLASIYIKLKKS